MVRVANPARGEERRPLAVVPAISVTLDREVGYARANAPIDRELRVSLRSAYEAPRDVSVRLELPQGLEADTLSRTMSLAGRRRDAHDRLSACAERSRWDVT